jgi:hypothetical protein
MSEKRKYKQPGKTVPSTRKILQESIKDIEAGLWMCGELTQECVLNGFQKPMGCALGLVGMNAGFAKFREEDEENFVYGEQYGGEYVTTGERVVISDLQYPNESNWSPQALKAVALLAETTRLTKTQIGNIREDGGDELLDVNPSIVIEYNDGKTGGNDLSKKAALSWFKRALAKLDERKS